MQQSVLVWLWWKKRIHSKMYLIELIRLSIRQKKMEKLSFTASFYLPFPRFSILQILYILELTSPILYTIELIYSGSCSSHQIYNQYSLLLNAARVNSYPIASISDPKS